jgi:GMP synthase-like glutamine amidotransferase
MAGANTVRIGILKTDAVRDEWVGRFGEYPDMFIDLLGARDPSLSFTVYDCQQGEYPAHIDDNDAYLITGSRHSVYEEQAWIRQLLEFVRDLHRARKPLVGICFGHQAVAQALGGRTAKAAQGWGVGIHHHRFFRTPPWFDDGDAQFAVLVSHQDQVVENAVGAEVLAGSEFCPYAVCQVGEHILTFQGHPEFVTAYSREIMDYRREVIGEDTYARGVASLAEQPDTERMAGWILNFLHRAAG